MHRRGGRIAGDLDLHPRGLLLWREERAVGDLVLARKLLPDLPEDGLELGRRGGLDVPAARAVREALEGGRVVLR